MFDRVPSWIVLVAWEDNCRFGSDRMYFLWRVQIDKDISELRKILNAGIYDFSLFDY